MPVSSPSYFPPQRSTDRIVGLNAGTTQTGNNVFLAGQDAGLDSTSSGLIIIGHLAGSGKITGQNNAVIIGVNAASALTTATNSSTDGPIIIGYNAAQGTISADDSVFIGANTFGQSPGGALSYRTNSVIIGSQIANGPTKWTNGAYDFSGAVIIGYGILNATLNNFGPNNSVFIGYEIGYQAERFEGSNSVIIGVQACAAQIPDYSVIIGSNAVPNLAAGTGIYITAVGAQAGTNSPTSGSYFGYNSGNGFSNTSEWVVIGSPVGSNYPGATAFSALANPQTDGAYNIGLGAASAGLNLGIASARNIVCLYNGTVGTANPTGGGYFYVDAGALHWVGSNGTDTLIATA